MNDDFFNDATPPSVGAVLSVEPDPFPAGPRCVFCGEVVSAHIDAPRPWAAHTQAVFDGWTEVNTMRKRPGATIYWHSVCGEPDGWR